MADQLDISEAAPQLSDLVERVEAGEEITLARAGRPVARLIPFTRSREPRRPGIWKGRVWLAPDWDSPSVNVGIGDLFEKEDVSEASAPADVLPLPPEWQRTFSGDPMPDVLTVLRRQREEH